MPDLTLPEVDGYDPESQRSVAFVAASAPLADGLEPRVLKRPRSLHDEAREHP